MLGTTLGAYRLDEQLGAGGMGTVYRATAVSATRSVAAGTVVAVKVLHPQLLQREGTFKRFLREAEIGKTVRHPNVVRTLDVDAISLPAGQAHFLVLELVEGQTLRELLDEIGRVPEVLCRRLASGIAAGLGALHAAGVVHRDLKPSNVLVTSDHEVKLMDLGVARHIDPTTDISESGAFVGSLRYAAPEQFDRGGVELDGRVDLHALGVVLYELATGRHPFRDGDFHEILHSILHDVPRRAGELNPQLSAFFEELVHKLLAKARDVRFTDARELLCVLQEGEEGVWWRTRARALREDTRRPLRRIRIPRETALYGREAELSRMHALYDRVRDGHGQVLVLQGEAGIGKTRLVDEFVGRLVESGEDVNFLFGSYPPGGAATDTGAFCTAYREQLGAAGLDATVATYLPETPALAPAFASLLRGDSLPSGVEPLNKDSLQTVFAAVTQRLASERPTIVLVDDLHFAPAEGRALFLALALAVAEHRVLLVGTSRTPVAEGWGAGLERLPFATTMAMERLGPSDLSRLLVDAFGSERLAATLALQVADRSDGNPFFVFEILRNLRESQRIQRRDDGSWATTSVLERIQLPQSLRQLVHARLAALDDADRDVLEMAACVGFEFDPLLVARALEMPEIPLLKRLGRLEHDSRVVRAVGRTCVFDHHQLREVLYEGLSELLRERYHARLGEALEGAGGVIAGARAVAICEQFLRGASVARALPFLDAALSHLDAGHLNEAAADLALRALADRDLVCGADRVNLELRVATWLKLAGDVVRERAVIDDAIAGARAMDDAELLVRAVNTLGLHLYFRAEYAAAEATLSEALELASRHGLETLECPARRTLGHVCVATGRLDEARGHYDRVLAIARATGQDEEAARSLGSIGVLLNRRGDRRGAIAAYEQELADCRRLGLRALEAMALGSLGNVYANLGDKERAKECYEGNLRIARELGDRRSEFVARYNLAHEQFRDGRMGDARDLFEEGIVLAREIDYREGVAAALGTLSMCYTAMGRLDRGLAILEESLAHARSESSRAIAHLNFVPMYARLGAHDEARDAARRAMECARAADNPRVLSYALFNCARLHHVLGEHDSAIEMMSESLALRREIEQLDELTGTLSALGEFLAAVGRVDEARVYLEEAVTVAERIERPGAREGAMARLAALGDAGAAEELTAEEPDPDPGHVPDALEHSHRVWKATGDVRHLRAAHRALLTLIEHAPERYVRTIVENVPAHAEIMAAVAALDDTRDAS